MRKSGFYPKLAWGNIVRNRQFYVPYLLTLGVPPRPSTSSGPWREPGICLS